jgi:hypothetical protein
VIAENWSARLMFLGILGPAHGGRLASPRILRCEESKEEIMSLPDVSSPLRHRILWSSIAAMTAFSVGFSGPASAIDSGALLDDDVWCRSCEVKGAGPLADKGTVGVWLYDPSGKVEHGWYEGKNSTDQILAVALAAINFRKPVDVNLDGDRVRSTINRIVLLKP